MAIVAELDRPADHDDAVLLLRDIRTVNDPTSRVHVLRDQEGAAKGAACWQESSEGPDGLAIALAPGQGIDQLLRLAQLCINDALARGHRQGTFVIHDAALLRTLQARFSLDATPIGWAPAAKGEEPFTAPATWQVTGDLTLLAAQLDAYFS